MTDTPIGTFVHDVLLDSISPESWGGFRLIDERGCLTDEVLCFVEELRSEQREVVERHLLTCSACTFQHHQLIQAAQMMRRAKPRVRFSSDARVLGRRAVVRAVLEHQPRNSTPSDRRARRRRRWLHIGLVLSLALMIVALSMVLMILLSGCHQRGSSSSSHRLRARFTQGERQGRLAPNLTTATGSIGGVGSPGGERYAGGTRGGEVWVLGPSGASFRLAPQPMSRPASLPSLRPASPRSASP
ncbi:MAG: hypothetical protein KAI47_06145, partial [Deltaproteobacteria bacterium]|nr:hypothetical protein [Deltaproteobacteria bacterium]